MASPVKKIVVGEFLQQAEQCPVIDVRSPSEFEHGHIPGAHNIPLFDDRERELVGTKYKKEGSESAILLGLELASPGMAGRLSRALEISAGRKLLVHCWRGGMRSEAMSWLFSLGGIETEVLEGGYKAYRHHVLDSLALKRKYLILGGLTGSGKTQILKTMKEKGHQVIDLEGLASHKGSAFGSLGMPGQPSSEHFANLLYDEVKGTDPDKFTWLEDESKNIGTVFMPDGFYDRMQESPVIALMMDADTRMPRLIKEYSKHSQEELLAAVGRISKKLGGDNTHEACKSIAESDFEKAIRITLNYYDKAYMFGIKRRPETNLVFVETDTDDISENIRKIIKASGRWLNA